MTETSASERRIRVLPPTVADKIAAGEVVERPASVVKELIENSLDAGASDIRIELEDAGVGLIAVVDDGCGIPPDDAVLAFARHATSKVRDVDDLFHIRTMGFRGEALASIAAVSTTTLVTRRAGDLGGTRVLVRGGEMAEVGETGAPVGTRIEVVDLFGNTPARRKFLKSAATEVGHVTEMVTRTALAFPGVGFHLSHGRRVLVDFPAGKPQERLAQVVGRDRAATMLRFQYQTPAGEVQGWLSGSHVSYPSNRQIFTYVNGRFVRDKLVSHAVTAGYSTLLMHGRYPGAVVFIEVPLEDVDVNVHPAKSEVRFRMGGAVHDLITRAVKECLRGQGPQLGSDRSDRSVGSDGSAGSVRSDPVGPPPIGRLRLVPFERAAGAPAAERPAWPPPQASPPPPVDDAAPGFFSGLQLIGQAFEGYLVCQSGDALVVIDQHAAHERVMFEKLRIGYGAGGVARQRLLVPVTVDVGPGTAAQLAEQAADLENLGFEIEDYGGGTVAVRAVPALLGDEDPAKLVRDLAAEVADVGSSRSLTQAAEGVLATLACHSAVRVGQTLGRDQVRALLASMDGIDFAHNCPHGRPAYITLRRGDLERLFKRT